MAPLAVPICTRAAIHLIGKVVSFLSRAAMATLPGSLRRRVAKSDSSQPRRKSSSERMRSGTSPLPNHGEAQAAESAKDFVHKLKICLKELRESWRWLLLIQRVPLLRPRLVDALVKETDELIRIFVRSIQTAEHRKR